jgi:hypothetical protein
VSTLLGVEVLAVLLEDDVDEDDVDVVLTTLLVADSGTTNILYRKHPDVIFPPSAPHMAYTIVMTVLQSTLPKNAFLHHSFSTLNSTTL